MTVALGIALAFVAMLSWGIGDFLIQRSTRKVGNWETLFILTAFGTIVLFPFVTKSLPELFHSNPNGVWLLFIASTVLFIAALLDLEALRVGKLAVVEPIWSFEIVAAAFLSYFLLGETITWIQVILIIILIVGLALVAIGRTHLSAKMFMEKGVMVAFLAAIAMGSAGFLMGWGARVTDPIMANFFTDAYLALACILYFAFKGQTGKMWQHIRHDLVLFLPMAVADKVAWLAFTFSMVLIPIAVATALSESYIIIAVLLGLFINKERMHYHQKIGLTAALIAAIALAYITAG